MLSMLNICCKTCLFAFLFRHGFRKKNEYRMSNVCRIDRFGSCAFERKVKIMYIIFRNWGRKVNSLDVLVYIAAQFVSKL